MGEPAWVSLCEWVKISVALVYYCCSIRSFSTMISSSASGSRASSSKNFLASAAAWFITMIASIFLSVFA